MNWYNVVKETLERDYAVKYDCGILKNPVKIKTIATLNDLRKEIIKSESEDLNYIDISVIWNLSYLFANTKKKYNFDEWNFDYVVFAENMFKNSKFTYNDINKNKNKSFQSFLDRLRETRTEEELKDYLGL